MKIKRFSIVFGMTLAAATAALAAPTRPGVAFVEAESAGIVLAQSVKERNLDEMPPVDAGRTPPPAARTGPPAPPFVPPAPRVTTRSAPPPADETGPPAREVPPPPTSTTRVAPPPPRLQEPAPIHRAAPRVEEPPPPPAVASPPRRPPPPAYDDPPPPRRADTRRAPPTRPQERSAFYANCTQQCHLSCEASFEACNGDSSPAKPACVKKLESCRIERCACRLD